MTKLDPLLSVPSRLFLLCGLSHGRWCGLEVVTRLVDGPAAMAAAHVRDLERAGYVVTRDTGVRFRARITNAGRDALGSQIEALAAMVSTAARLTDEARVLVVTGALSVFEVPAADGGAIFLTRSDVIFAEADRDRARLFTRDGTHVVPCLATLQRRWPDLMRVHRRYLVAVEAVRRLRRNRDGSYEVLTDRGAVPVSRRKAREVRAVLARRAATSGA